MLPCASVHLFVSSAKRSDEQRSAELIGWHRARRQPLCRFSAPDACPIVASIWIPREDLVRRSDLDRVGRTALPQRPSFLTKSLLPRPDRRSPMHGTEPRLRPWWVRISRPQLPSVAFSRDACQARAGPSHARRIRLGYQVDFLYHTGSPRWAKMVIVKMSKR